MKKLLAVSSMFAASTAMAAPKFDIGNFRPPAVSGGVLEVDSAYTAGHITPAASLWFDYAHDPLVYKENGNIKDEIIRHQYELQGAFSMSFWKRLEIGVVLPVTMFQTGNIDIDGSRPAHHALGDLRFDAKVHLASVPLGVGRAVGFAIAAGLTFPTGTPADSYSTGGWQVMPRFITTFLIRPAELTLQVGGIFGPKATLGQAPADVTIGQFLTLAASLRFNIVRGFGVMGTIAADVALNGTTGAIGSPIEALGGLDYRWKKVPFSIEAAGGAGLTQAVGTADWRVIFGVRYQPRPVLDRDHDGVPDLEDHCPYVKGIKENAGCPDTDSDGDGIIDRLDHCPTQFGPADNQGCPWPDRDNDGVIDRDDMCPAVAGPKENKGCPDTDKDSDKIVDREDKCPDVAGPAENQGCPWPDQDGDKVVDKDDKCPREPGPAANEGCPVLDRDGDGIPDSVDKCPDEKETFNGIEDEDGCPEKGPTLAVLNGDQIEIKQQVFFATGKAIIGKSSYPLLAAVGAIIKLHPEIEKLRIEGHTDSQGKREANLKLSQDRADAVMNHLIVFGKVDASRLEAKGFGPDVPVSDNKTAAGRAKNRRSAFIVVAKKGK